MPVGTAVWNLIANFNSFQAYKLF